MKQTICQIKRIKTGERFKPIAREYMEYTKTPSRITGIKKKWQGIIYICCQTDNGRIYDLEETDKVIRWQ